MKFYHFLLWLFVSANFCVAQPFMKDDGLSQVLVDLEKGTAEWCDYDMDYDMDIFLSGLSESGPFSALYRNDNGSFSMVEEDFYPLEESDMYWNDFDLDGDPDVYLSGKDIDGNIIGKLYENLGDDTFESTWTNPQPLFNGKSVWADLDNDGDQDLVTIGNEGSGGLTLIYRNDGDGSFENIPHWIKNIYKGDIDIADYDRDLDQDILICGIYKDESGEEQKLLRIYTNNGEFQFSELSSGFVGLGESNCRWADYDGDGDLDILANGSTEAPTHLVYIYQNEGYDSFLNIGIEIFGTVNGSVEWGDYDNDGDFDFLLTGMPSYGSNPITEIYRNVSTNLFNKATVSLPEVYMGCGKWGDYDHDGDLDVLVLGLDTSGTRTTAVYINTNTLVNSLPEIPSGITSLVTGNQVVLAWEPSSDVESPNKSLFYNVWVKKSLASKHVMSSLAGENGNRFVVSSGNASLDTAWYLQNLSPGEYQWKVQSLDNNYSGSAFSEIHSFTVENVGIFTNDVAVNSGTSMVYPNPIQGNFILKANNGVKDILNIRWYTMNGHLVAITPKGQLMPVQATENNYFWKINQPNLRHGVYLLEVFSETKQKTVDLLKVLVAD